MTPRIFIIITAYNESKVISAVLEDLLSLRNLDQVGQNPDYQLVVVDDGSQDSTQEKASHYPVHLLRHAINLGQGAALVTGMQYALRFNPNVIVTFDADGQHIAEDIPALVEPILSGQAEIALGSRFLDPKFEIPRRRRILLKLAIFFNGLTQGIWLSDAHNGLRAMSADAARQIRITQNRMAHASEITSEITRLKLGYIEVPVHVKYTDYSRLKGQKTSDFLNILIDLLEGRIR